MELNEHDTQADNKGNNVQFPNLFFFFLLLSVAKLRCVKVFLLVLRPKNDHYCRISWNYEERSRD